MAQMTSQPPTARATQAPDMGKLRAYLVNQIQRHLEGNPPPPDQRKQIVEQLLEQAYAQTKVNLPRNMKAGIFKEILDDLLGYGPIQTLLDDPSVSNG